MAASRDRPLRVEGSPATPAGSLDSPTAHGATACPWSPSPSTAAAAATIFTCGDATASWPGIAFPRRRANPIPVGGAGAVMMSPTPPRYMPGAPAPPATTSEISMQGRLCALSASSTKLGDGLNKIYGKALMIGLAAADFCNWAGLSGIPGFFEAHVINFTDWSQLPGFFKGLSCVLDGASDVLIGSAQAFGAMRGYFMQHEQGINSILSYYIIKRSCVDSVLVVQDRSGARRSPKKVLPRLQFIRTQRELRDAVKRFKKGEPVHLVDVSEEDVPLELALDFWKHLLAHGATALLRRDSNLCRMSKMAYSLLVEKQSLQAELATLNSKVDDIKHSITLLSDLLGRKKTKSAKLPGSARSIDFTGIDGHMPSASSYEKRGTNLLASEERLRTVKATNVSLSATMQDIEEFFSFSGDIENVEMQSGDEWSQVAYVTFKDAEGAETALLLSGGTMVDLSVITAPAPEYQPPPTVSAPPMELNQTSTETNFSDAV